MSSSPRIAIVHEWFTSMRGGEKCVEALCEVFPEATLFTLLHLPGSVSPVIERMPIKTSFIQHLPLAHTHYRHYLPLFPTAIQRFDLSAFDVVISSSHCVAKGVKTGPRTLHVCYCHTPMRYIWDQYDEYFGKGRASLVTRWGMALARGYLQRWDIATARNPDHFIANSRNVQERIRRIFGRESEVIYPPVDTSKFTLSTKPGAYFLVVSAFVPYKRIDLAIEACARTGDRLVIVGDGPDADRLKAISGGKVEFRGPVDDDELKGLYAECWAVIFPGEEDFGIVPVEAMASGKPVIAFEKGGALETVMEGSDLRTGVLFKEQTVESLIRAIEMSKSVHFEPTSLRTFALRFDTGRYKREMFACIKNATEKLVA